MTRPDNCRNSAQQLTAFQWEEEVGEEAAALKLVQSIEVNTKHYVEILSRAIDDCMPESGADPTYVVPRIRPRRENRPIDLVTDSRTTFWMF